MLLTQSQFQQQYDEGKLRICFIGMSNIGKSHCSRLLRDEFGFDVYEVDAEIQAAMDIPDMEDASTWMGYPYEEKYTANEKFYLELEVEKTKADLSNLNGNLVMDTTGSVIYLDGEIHTWLKNNFLLVSFDVSHDMIEDMMTEFFRSPKTVVWGDSFSQQPGEKNREALKRCYPNLLENRISRYRDLTDVTMPGEFSRTRGLKANRFFEILKLSLPKE